MYLLLLFQVYVKAKCPKSFRLHQIKWKCENWTAFADNDDLDSITPVTDVNNRITYANVYCAMCNSKMTNVTSVKNHLVPWNVTFSCSETASKDANKTGAFNANESMSLRIDREVKIETNSSEVKFVANPVEEAAKYAQFDPQKKIFTSWYKGTHYKCNHVKAKPLGDIYGLRACIPGISTCSSSVPHDTETAHRCESFTSFVFDHLSQKAFKNIFCTVCNTNETNMVVCPGDKLDEKTGGSTLFTTKDKAVGSVDPCKIPALRSKFC